MKATEFLEKILVAERPVVVFDGYPNSASRRTVAKGREIGRIYSYVEEPDGLYWQIYTESGSNDKFVKHDRLKLDVREGTVSLSNLVAEFIGIESFGEVAEQGKAILTISAVGLAAFAIIKASNFFD